jgi:hypothetical protein
MHVILIGKKISHKLCHFIYYLLIYLLIYLVVAGFGLRALYLLGRCSTTSATLPASSYVSYMDLICEPSYRTSKKEETSVGWFISNKMEQCPTHYFCQHLITKISLFTLDE